MTYQVIQKLNVKTERNEKSAKRRKHCALAVVRWSQKHLAPPQTPSRGRRTAKIYLQIQFGEDRCTQFRVIVVTDPRTHTHTHTSKQTQPTDWTNYNTLRR